MRPGSASAYVDFSFESVRYSRILAGSSWPIASSVRTSASVEYPVLVRRLAGSLSFSKSTWASCFGDPIVNGSPAIW